MSMIPDFQPIFSNTVFLEPKTGDRNADEELVGKALEGS
jgi:hypothetical protein